MEITTTVSIGLFVSGLGIGFAAGFLVCYWRVATHLMDRLVSMKKLGWSVDQTIDQQVEDDPSRDIVEY